MTKISIRFPLGRDEVIFDDREVHAVWNEEKNSWLFSLLYIVAVLNDHLICEKNRNY